MTRRSNRQYAIKRIATASRNLLDCDYANHSAYYSDPSANRQSANVALFERLGLLPWRRIPCSYCVDFASLACLSVFATAKVLNLEFLRRILQTCFGNRRFVKPVVVGAD